MNVYGDEEPKEPDYPLFVRWNGGPSIWVHVNESWVLLEEVLEHSNRDLNQNQTREIGLLANDVMRRQDSTTYPINPIKLSRGEVEKLLEILVISEHDFRGDIVVESILP